MGIVIAPKLSASMSWNVPPAKATVASGSTHSLIYRTEDEMATSSQAPATQAINDRLDCGGVDAFFRDP
jgi:hypothetical protein